MIQVAYSGTCLSTSITNVDEACIYKCDHLHVDVCYDHHSKYVRLKHVKSHSKSLTNAICHASYKLAHNGRIAWAQCIKHVESPYLSPCQQWSISYGCRYNLMQVHKRDSRRDSWLTLDCLGDYIQLWTDIKGKSVLVRNHCTQNSCLLSSNCCLLNSSSLSGIWLSCCSMSFSISSNRFSTSPL